MESPLPLKINKHNKEAVLERKQKILSLLQEGYDHNYIANELGMRPQNVLAWIRKHDQKLYKEEESIVTPTRQRETLEDASEKIKDEIERIDTLLDKYYDLCQDNLKDKSQVYHKRVVELLRIKRSYLEELVNMWAIPTSIEKTIKVPSPSPIKGKNVQINFGHLERDREKLKKVSDGIVKIIDEVRFSDETTN